MSLPLRNCLVSFLMNYDFPSDNFVVERNWWIWCRIFGFRYVGDVIKDLQSPIMKRTSFLLILVTLKLRLHFQICIHDSCGSGKGMGQIMH